MKFNKTLLAAALMFASVSASATAILTADDLNTAGVDQTVLDGGLSDLNTSLGAITASGSVGSWNLYVNTGFSNATVPTNIAGDGLLDLHYIVTGSGSFQATLSDDFNLQHTRSRSLLDGNYQIQSKNSVTPGTASVAYSIFDDSTLVDSGSQLLTGTNGSYHLGQDFDFSSLGNSNLKIALTFTTDANTKLSTTSGDFLTTQVPEPATVALLGLALTGLGFARRNKKA